MGRGRCNDLGEPGALLWGDPGTLGGGWLLPRVWREPEGEKFVVPVGGLGGVVGIEFVVYEETMGDILAPRDIVCLCFVEPSRDSTEPKREEFDVVELTVVEREEGKEKAVEVRDMVEAFDGCRLCGDEFAYRDIAKRVNSAR